MVTHERYAWKLKNLSIWLRLVYPCDFGLETMIFSPPLSYAYIYGHTWKVHLKTKIFEHMAETWLPLWFWHRNYDFPPLLCIYCHTWKVYLKTTISAILSVCLEVMTYWVHFNFNIMFHIYFQTLHWKDPPSLVSKSRLPSHLYPREGRE